MGFETVDFASAHGFWKETYVHIRPAVPEDVPALASIHVSSWRSTYRGLLPDGLLEDLSVEDRESMWQRQIAFLQPDPARGCVFIAEDEDGDEIGFASGGPEREVELDFEGELYTIYVLREHQGRGVGRRLLGHVVDHLRAHGLASMRVWVLEGNPAGAFYERLGGQRVGEKEISMGGNSYVEVAYGWWDLGSIGAST